MTAYPNYQNAISELTEVMAALAALQPPSDDPGWPGVFAVAAAWPAKMLPRLISVPTGIQSMTQTIAPPLQDAATQASTLLGNSSDSSAASTLSDDLHGVVIQIDEIQAMVNAVITDLNSIPTALPAWSGGTVDAWLQWVQIYEAWAEIQEYLETARAPWSTLQTELTTVDSDAATVQQDLKNQNYVLVSKHTTQLDQDWQTAVALINTLPIPSS